MKKVNIEAIKSELDIEKIVWMDVNIDRKYVEIIEPMILEILSYFKCSRCGECCITNPPTIQDDELVEIGKEIGNEAFNALDDNFLMNVFKTPCRFLEDKGCRIYNVRPKVCRLFPLALNKMMMVTLYLCPMGKEIQIAIESFIKSKGLKSNYKNKQVEPEFYDLKEMYKFVGFQTCKPSEATMQIGIYYPVIPLFLKYLKSGKK